MTFVIRRFRRSTRNARPDHWVRTASVVRVIILHDVYATDGLCRNWKSKDIAKTKFNSTTKVYRARVCLFFRPWSAATCYCRFFGRAYDFLQPRIHEFPSAMTFVTRRFLGRDSSVPLVYRSGPMGRGWEIAVGTGWIKSGRLMCADIVKIVDKCF